MIINRIQVLNYGCLRYVDVPMDRFHVLIGPNASGKSTLMDAIKFVSDVVRDGVEAAWMKRTSNFADLVWGRPDAPEEQRFEIALEFGLSDEVRGQLPADRAFTLFRYEMAIGVNPETDGVSLLEERGDLHPDTRYRPRQLSFFPSPINPPDTLMTRRVTQGRRNVFRRHQTTLSRFSVETVDKTGSINWSPGFNLSSDRSMMTFLPDRGNEFPASTLVMTHLRDHVVTIALSSALLREASPPGLGIALRPDGSNVPWVVERLHQAAPERWEWWMGHIQCALDGFEMVRTIRREDDAHRYLMVNYTNGLQTPSWKVSDGTLRLLALTMLAYLPDANGLYLIEEPENGIHPGVLEALYDSLSCVYDAQVLLASHSPEFVAIANVDHLLCFGKTRDGVVDLVRGEAHPLLVDWQHETDLGTFFASGILA
ncbi:MAG: AAA family ATPase [Chloroflexi bacterium]|nr:AAA family ATPase [Chloroflexota bacterium]